MMDISIQLEDLKSVAEKLSIKIETGNLADAEFSIESGFCKVKGENLILMDKKLDPEEQVSVILSALKNFDLETIYVPAWIREQLGNTPSSGKTQ